MRVLKNEAGKVIGVSMDDEPKRGRPDETIITTRNTPVKTRAERNLARQKAEADRAAAKIEAEKKGGAK